MFQASASSNGGCAQGMPAAAEQRTAFEDRLSVLRRIILGADIALLATLGYWIGNAIGGKWPG